MSERLVAQMDGSFEYDPLLRQVIGVSSDLKRIALIERRGKQYHVVLDGSPGKLYDEIGFPVFSEDTGHFAYTAKQDNH